MKGYCDGCVCGLYARVYSCACRLFFFVRSDIFYVVKMAKNSSNHSSSSSSTYSALLHDYILLAVAKPQKFEAKRETQFLCRTREQHQPFNTE